MENLITRAGGLAQQSWRAELMELEGKLARSTAAWKLVIGHHPIFSSGQHGSTTDLVHTLDPVLRKYGVQVNIDRTRWILLCLLVLKSGL